MENILDWAKSIDKNKRGKPNKQLQQELFARIQSLLNESDEACFDCLQALMKFDKLVLAPFYTEHYPQMNDQMRKQWDASLARWANGVKPTENATIRIAIIIREKLRYVKDACSLLAELRWLSLNDDKRSIKEFESIRDNSTVTNLCKLLSLDATVWTTGKAQIKKMYEIIFSASEDTVTQQMYAEFLVRHGWNDKVGNETPKNEQMSADDVTSSAEITETPNTETIVDSHTVTGSSSTNDGVALAEALLAWSREQQEILRKQAAIITELRLKEQKSDAQIVHLTEQIASLESVLSNETKQKEEAEYALRIAQNQVDKLEDEKAQANDTIGRVQQMAGNSAKQELDGFRHSLASELQKTVKDSQEDISDLSEAEKAEVYKALFDELIDTLKHHGIQIEVN